MWHVETDYFALAVFLIMYIKEFGMHRIRRQRKIQGTRDTGDLQSESFYYVLFFSIISTIIDIMSSTAMNGCKNWWVYQILVTLYVISMPLLAAVWVGYAYILIHHDDSIRTFLKKITFITIPYIVYALIALSNPFTGLFFKLSPDMEYERGIFFMPVGVGFIMLYSGVGLLLVIFCWKKITPRFHAFLLTAFFLFTGVLTWVQLAHPGWLIINASYAVIYVWCDIAIEDQRRRILYQEIEKKNIELEEAVLEAKEANAAKTTFLSNMSHDIRTPMNAIVGITNLMAHDKDDPVKTETYIHKIQIASKHLLGLVNDVLDMGKIEAGEVLLTEEPISLAEQVWQVESIIRPRVEEFGQDFTICIHKIRHEYLTGDAVRLRQILINLLSNAIKYTPYGGKITFELTEQFCEDTDNAEFYIRVADNGRGMFPEFLEHIFEPFTRAENSMTNKVQGTGLGMAITKNIVDMMGGTITVQSEPDKGSCFEVVLRFKIDDTHKIAFPFEHVLLISDEEDFIENAKAAFTNVNNIKLDIANTEKEADSILLNQSVDIVLLGSSLGNQKLENHVHQIREVTGKALLLYCCKYEERKQLIEIENKGGVDGIVVRPFFLSTLVNTIDGLMNCDEEGKNVKESVLKGMKFLCAEDNELNAEILNAILDIKGAGCDIYPNGEKLVEAFDKVKAGDYDAILMDVQMPVMDGLKATRVIRQGKNPLGKSIPIIAMTANAFSSDVQDCLSAGMDAHISKPLDIGILERIMKGIRKG